MTFAYCVPLSRVGRGVRGEGTVCAERAQPLTSAPSSPALLPHPGEGGASHKIQFDSFTRFSFKE